jgi:peptidoglycan hydrolase-like protein with peptidoglycan-binding domain
MGLIRASATARTASRGSSGTKRQAPLQRNEPPTVGAHTDTEEMLHLQATAGNRAVQRLLAAAGVLQREGDDLAESNGSGGGTATATATLPPDPNLLLRSLPPDPNLKLKHAGALPPDPNLKLKQPGAHLPPDPNDLLKQPGAQLPPDPNLKLKQPGALPPDPNLKLQGGQPAPPKPDFGAAIKQIKATRNLVIRSTKQAVAKRNLAHEYFIKGHAHWNVDSQSSGVQAAQMASLAADAAKAAQDELTSKGAWSAQFDAAHDALMHAPVKTRTANWQDISYAGKGAEKIRTIENTAKAAAQWANKAHEPLRLPKSGPTGIIGIMQQKLNQTRAAGPRLPITAVFTNDTDTALRAFQGANGLTVSGTADVATWAALNKKAPSYTRNLETVVDSKEGAQQTKPENGAIHPVLNKGDRSEAVREMQQRLNNWVNPWPGPGTAPYKPFRANGYFGSTDRKALVAFQHAHKIPETGVADQKTWLQLDGVPGAITSGAREFGWNERVEGVANVGETARYSWAVKGDSVTITVKINFKGKKNHPMVKTWLQDIKDVWNSYKAVEVGKPQPREYRIEFSAEKSSSAPHDVTVKKPEPDGYDRSDSRNWYVSDKDRGLAPHEFGHIIGLEDEYNRPEEEAVAASGLEPTIGALRSATGKTPKQIATELHTLILANAAKTPKQQLKAIANKVTHHGLMQGAFARAVEQEYKAAWGFNGAPNLSNMFGAIIGSGFEANLSIAATPFTVSNQSLMGEMGSVGARGRNLNKLTEHTHPVQPRHVRAFANLLSLSFPGTKWAPKRR